MSSQVGSSCCDAEDSMGGGGGGEGAQGCVGGRGGTVHGGDGVCASGV